METDLETFSKEASEQSGSFLGQLRVENRERQDYREFLRKFSVLREEMGTDPDTFDYGFYSYGLSLYGNMPLIEPLETREVRRIADFVMDRGLCHRDRHFHVVFRHACQKISGGNLQCAEAERQLFPKGECPYHPV